MIIRSQTTTILSACTALASAVVLAGCATAEPIVGPDGSTNQLIKCPTMNMCYDKARQACGGNYKIVNTTTDTSGAQGTTSSSYEMLVKCGR